MANSSDIRRRREQQSAFSGLYNLVNARNAALAREGRRPVLGGLLSKEPVVGLDTLRYEGIAPMLSGLLAPMARAIDAPAAAYQGNIPQGDMVNEALGAAGFSMLGGGLLSTPSRASNIGQTLAANKSRDVGLLFAVDRPDVLKEIFLDDSHAADLLGELRGKGEVADAAPLSAVNEVKDYLYQQTQSRLSNLPDEITVYRAGKLNERDGISSFTLNPSYNPDLNLPWNKDRGSPKLNAYKVKKSDILVTPDLIRDFGEGEVVIRNSSVY
jgi:hypothetical protein